ncbi:hypothetical protein ANACAC_01894 [Anaerostipes caccae L1-92]|uniref:Uncharacterized protein n=1 Tax=Anaerostipes caccae (strain DSM 14662 / CCUG 47493 / JCM 13470 / NCIMB 13811 / L1-92) TaxID=411490 RepID=B0ME99_ANACD|nr:hypothetical protein ANACAC_01894 [Anaerostipes caccae L1-92]
MFSAVSRLCFTALYYKIKVKNRERRDYVFIFGNQEPNVF